MRRAFILLLLLPKLAWAQTPLSATPEPSSFGSPCAYPEIARAAHSEGMTWLSYRGSRQGTVEEVKVLQSSGHIDLDDAAVQCMSHWRYNPEVADAKPDLEVHKISVTWLLPQHPSDKVPVGVFAGVPDTCFQYYPEAEEKAGIEGKARLRFTVTERGDVRDPVVVQSSGNTNLDNAALRCATTWTYRPGVSDGKPVAVSWEAEVIWNAPKPTIADDERKSRIICRETEVTGSLLAGARVCHSRAEWDEISRRTQDDLHRVQSGVNRPGGGMTPGR